MRRPESSGLFSAELPARAATVKLEQWPERTAMQICPAQGRASALAVEQHGSGLDAQRQYRMSRLTDLLLASNIAMLLPQAATPFQLVPEDNGTAK